ncbi:MAG TPA: VacJ family lipoprotein [Burkholderiaceae bacterium]|nr:VacJ family lipoprotein [Burkholderiaceae bacterium]
MTLWRVAALWVIGALALDGCASTPATRGDPFEDVNRAVFSFNEGLDKAVLKPVAEGYQAVLPEFVRTSIANFFNNFNDGWSAINHLLQGKPAAALEMGMRFSANTVFGFGGLFDVAGASIERRPEDFGQTLGRWGLPPGPYLVLPVLGPSTVRDGTGLLLDFRAVPEAFLEERPERWALGTLHVISVRAGLLAATRTLDEIALDKYSLIRDGYLVRRRNLVYDGNPPEEPEPQDNESNEGSPPK